MVLREGLKKLEAPILAKSASTEVYVGNIVPQRTGNLGVDQEG